MTADDDDPPDNEQDEGPETTSDVATVDSATAGGVRGQRKKAERERNEAIVFWQGLLRDPVGRREVWLLLNVHLHAFNANFATSPNGAPYQEAAWYHRGRQDAGLELYHRLFALDPAGILAMHKEYDPRFAEPPKPRARRMP